MVGASQSGLECDCLLMFIFDIDLVLKPLVWKKETYAAPNHRQLGDQLRGRVAKCLRIEI